MFTDEDIQYGAGAFEQTMRTQMAIPGGFPKISPGVAVGILSAAMRSGLPATSIDELIDQHFGSDANLLSRVRDMYEDNDWSINLWHLLPTGKYKLCTELCRPGMARWRYDPSLIASDE